MIEVTGLVEWVGALARLAPTIVVTGHVRLTGTAGTVAADAQGRAPYRSGKLRAGIAPRVTATTVAVVSSAPHARITESGGRHPVFGHRAVMVAQAARPYLAPALDDGGDDLEKAAVDALDDALLTLLL